MKCIVVIHLVLVAAIYGCREFRPDPLREFIPGTYIRYSEHAFGHESDTLVITMHNVSAKEFMIVRKWKYERVLDGVLIEPEYKKFVTTVVYDARHQQLHERETGDMYSFNLRARVLYNGSLKYQKL